MIIINYGILSFGWLSIIELPSEWIEYKKSIVPSVSGRHGVVYEADRSRREYPSGDGIRLISVNAGGSIPPSRMSPGRSRIAGSTSGHCSEKIKMIWGTLEYRKRQKPI